MGRLTIVLLKPGRKELMLIVLGVLVLVLIAWVVNTALATRLADLPEFKESFFNGKKR